MPGLCEYEVTMSCSTPACEFLRQKVQDARNRDPYFVHVQFPRLINFDGTTQHVTQVVAQDAVAEVNKLEKVKLRLVVDGHVPPYYIASGKSE